MSKFRFCGNPANDNNGRLIDPNNGMGIEAFGLEFYAKRYTDVSDKNIVAKLKGNSHFEEQTSKAEA